MLLPHGLKEQLVQSTRQRDWSVFCSLCSAHKICVPSLSCTGLLHAASSGDRPTRKPLIAMTPESLLCRSQASSFYG